jgi:hypothetical protein
MTMSKHAKATRWHTIGAPLRGAGVFAEREHDPYAAEAKAPKGAVCPDCRAVYSDGRWQWLAVPKGARGWLCPACRRTRDRFPAGFVWIVGDFFHEHRHEMMELVRHHADRVKAEHPLERVMAIEPSDDGVLVTTTDPHLARGIGEALHRAYRGDLTFRYEPGQDLLRVHWKR